MGSPPLLPLDADEVVDVVLAATGSERLTEHIIAFQGTRRVEEVLGQQLDAQLGQPGTVEVVQVQVRGRVARVEALRHAVQAGGEDRGRGEVRVARAVDRAVLDAPRVRDPQHLRAVVAAVADVDGRPGGAAGGADDEALVGVHGRRRQRDVRLRVRLQAADEVVGVARQAHAVRVVGGVGVEHVDPVLPQAHVEVAAVAGQVPERLGHERRDEPALLRERLDHVAEEHGAVAGRQRVGVREVLLELAVGVLVVGGVVVPAELVEVPRDVPDEVEVAGERPHVVTGLLHGVERVGDLDRPVVGAAQQEVLELRADLQLEAELGGLGELAAQDRARAVRPRLAVDVEVAGEARDLRLPRQHREARRVGHRDEVGVVGPLAHGARRVAGESRAVGEQVVEVRGGDELGARLAVHVDELREQELHVVLSDVGADLVDRRRHGAPCIGVG